mgnify:CR=1 FL=1
MAISGTITVTAAGTSVQAATKDNVRSLVFKARSDNTGTCFLGGSDVSATDGMSLVPGKSIQMEFRDPVSCSQFWADAANNDDPQVMETHTTVTGAAYTVKAGDSLVGVNRAGAVTITLPNRRGQGRPGLHR